MSSSRKIDPRVFAPNFAMQDNPPAEEIPGIESPQLFEDADPLDTAFSDVPDDPTESLPIPQHGPPAPDPIIHNERQEGKPFGFALAHGTGGASIWWGQLAAQVCVVEVTRVNEVITTITQQAISKTIYYPPSNLDTDTRLQTHLGWYGDVWLYWECDDSGMITAVEVKGPDEPDGENISALDANLNRTTTQGKYYVKIGTVNENDPVDQKVSGDVPFFATVVKGVDSSSSSDSSGSDGSSSGSTSTSSSGSLGSDKSTAIVPVTFYSTGYTALFTLEAPDVRFEDVMVVFPKRKKFIHRIDKRFVEVCEKDSIAVISTCPSTPAVVGAHAENGAIHFEIITRRKLPKTIAVKVSGIRRGFNGMRFPTRTEAQFLANERFLNSAYPRK